MKMSSMYRARRSGLWAWVLRNLRRTTDRKILAIVGEKAAPIAVLFTCWNVKSANLKKL